MSKNKLIWNIALFLIVVIGLPIAYAQAAGGGGGFSLYYLIVNAAVVGLVLFVLQSFLVTQKNPKETTSVWSIVLIASLLIAWLFGKNGYIWEVGPIGQFLAQYKWYFLLVNSAVIAIVLYFIFGYLDVPKKLGSSTEGKTGYGLLLFFFAAVIAVTISPNSWIWQQETLRSLFSFLFASEKGILSPRGSPPPLLIFVSSFILFAFFFKNFLLKQGDQKLNYAMALIFAMNLASPPVNPIRDVVRVGELFFTLILWETLKPTMDNKSWPAFMLSLFLVGWASAALTTNLPNDRGILGGIACGFMDCKGAGDGISGLWGTAKIGMYVILAILGGLMLLWFFGGEKGKKIGGWGIGLGLLVLILVASMIFGWGIIGSIGLVLLIPLLLLGLGVYGVSRGNERESGLKEGWIRVWTKILQRLRQNRVTAKVVGDWLEMGDPTLEGELPLALKDLRVEVYTLMNFILRHEIFVAKYRNTLDLVDEFGNLTKGREKVLATRIPTPEAINDNMKKYIEGGKIERINPEEEWSVEIDTETKRANIGFARSYYLILKLMDQLKSELETTDLKQEPPDRQHYEGERSDAVNNWSDNTLQQLTGSIEDRYKRYHASVRRFRVVNLIRAQWTLFLDMYNLYGKYKRGYRFAKYGTKPDIYKYEVKDPSLNLPLWEINWKDSVKKIGTAETAPNFEPGTEYLIEVDIYGYSTSDINAIQIEKKSLPYIRKWKNSDIGYLHMPDSKGPRFSEVLDLAAKDWGWFVEDIEKGNYHPYSRRIQDYDTDLVSKGYMNFKAARFNDLLDVDQIAFDLEGIKNPGEFVYWGKKNYYDKTRESLRSEPVNPYPAISLKGLWSFINLVTFKRVKEPDLARTYMDYMKLQYRNLEKPTGQQKGGAP